jgi:predicted deacylase
MTTSVEELTGIVGALRISASHEFPRPHVGVVGAVHGNEPCGLRAIERLRAELVGGELSLRQGTLFLIHGNPRATEEQKRHTEGGADLNRFFDFRFIDEKASETWLYEHHRAFALKPLLESLDAVLDLHSTSAPSPAFAIASPVPESQIMADAVGVGYVTLGWDRPGLLGDKVLISPTTRRGLPAVSVECGQHDDPHSAQVAYLCARRALSFLGLLDPIADVAPRSTTRLMLQAAVKRPSPTFRFVRPLRSMERLSAGELIGRDENLTLSANGPCWVIMPNDTVPVGEDMLYIAQD